MAHGRRAREERKGTVVPRRMETPKTHENGETNKAMKGFLIPQRVVMGIMGTLAIVNAYTMRVSLSLAITEMRNPKYGGISVSKSACAASKFVNATKLHVKARGPEYDWNNDKQGLILSAFYFGYIVTHLPGGMIAEKFGGKYCVGLAIMMTSTLTCVTPFVLYASHGNWMYFVAIRIVIGLGEGTTFPALTALLAKWVPVQERATIGTLVYAGSQVGTIIANSASGILIEHFGAWSVVFYGFGIIGMFWVCLWMLLVYSSPYSHPFISDKEKAYLRREITNVSTTAVSIPWKHLLTSKPVWALILAQVGHDWGFYIMITDLPSYMKEVLAYDVKQNGFLTTLPYVLMWLVSMLSGWLCDYLVHQRNVLTICQARKIFTFIAGVGPASFIVAASYSGCDRNLAVAMFSIAMGLMGTFYCGMKVNALDLSPNFAGTLMAIVNGTGSIAGMIVPYLASALTKHHTLTEWRLVFWISFAVMTITTTSFAFFGSGKVQHWNEGKAAILARSSLLVNTTESTPDETANKGGPAKK